jgi:hypothetical protein
LKPYAEWFSKGAERMIGGPIRGDPEGFDERKLYDDGVGEFLDEELQMK